ncbi:MAG: sodium:alanine symporter family protein [Firmicutes bacterium]|jgi:AGCS family alanine or glycine:cation symporter|nr:sodium:alanine symporter family protein [Bacillota bacterium]
MLVSLFNKLAEYLWGPPMIILLLLTGTYLTIRSGFFQLAKVGFILKSTLGAILSRQATRVREGKPGVLTPFQAISTALAGTVGNGNIAGVATAIATGGPGAVFWMWVVAVLGMMTKMVEVTLGVHYREVREDGSTYGGPMYYIEKGLGKNWKPLAVFFSISTVIGALGTAVWVQPHTMGLALKSTFGIHPMATSVVASALTGAVIIGGFKRIGKFCEYITPFMCLFYIAGGLVVILVNVSRIPEAFGLIFRHAFAPAPAVGGFAGAAVAAAIRRGMARGMFSNEAGMGSSPMVHATVVTDDPVRQGLWGAFEVFADTIVVCTITALSIMCTGVWTSGKSGVDLTIMAFHSVWGWIGTIIVTLGVLLFAYSTMVGYAFEYETALNYLFGPRVIPFMRVVYLIPPIIAAGKPLEFAWTVVDVSTGLMGLPNLVALFALAGVFVRLLKDFRGREGIS